MTTKIFYLLLIAPLMGLISCAGPDVRVVKPKPELMYELNTDRSDRNVVALEGDASPAPSKVESTPDPGLRLPNMEELPTSRELESRKSSTDNPSGGVIARPPSN